MIDIIYIYMILYHIYICIMKHPYFWTNVTARPYGLPGKLELHVKHDPSTCSNTFAGPVCFCIS